MNKWFKKLVSVFLDSIILIILFTVILLLLILGYAFLGTHLFRNIDLKKNIFNSHKTHIVNHHDKPSYTQKYNVVIDSDDYGNEMKHSSVSSFKAITNKNCLKGVTVTIQNNTNQPIIIRPQRPLELTVMHIRINDHDNYAPIKTVPAFGSAEFKYAIINSDIHNISVNGMIYLFIKSVKPGEVYAEFPYLASADEANSDIHLTGDSGNIALTSNQQYKVSARIQNNCHGVLNVYSVGLTNNKN